MQSSSVLGEVEAEKEVRRLTLFAAGRDAAGKVPPREWEAMAWCQRLAHMQGATVVAAAGAASADGTGAAGGRASASRVQLCPAAALAEEAAGSNVGAAQGQIPGTHSQK